MNYVFYWLVIVLKLSGYIACFIAIIVGIRALLKYLRGKRLTDNTDCHQKDWKHFSGKFTAEDTNVKMYPDVSIEHRQPVINRGLAHKHYV